MQKRFQAFALPALAATGLALVSNAAVELIPPSQLTAYAPTEFDTNRTAMKAVNGAGMNANGLTHNADQTMMWMSENTVPTWFLVNLGAEHVLDEMKIWNFNMAGTAILARGINDIDIYVSSEANPPRPPVFSNTAVWKFVKNTSVAKAGGSATEPVSATIPMNDTAARWVGLKINSRHPSPDGNYGGISEIRFWKQVGAAASLDAITSVAASSVSFEGVADLSGAPSANLLAVASRTNAPNDVAAWEIVEDFGAVSDGPFTETLNGLAADTGYRLALCVTNVTQVPMWSAAKTLITGAVTVDALADVMENGAAAQIVFRRPLASTNVALAVAYKLTGTAAATVDYQPLAGSFVFAEGEYERAVAFTPINNALTDGDRSVVVTVLPGPYMTSPASSATFQILDDESRIRTVTWDGGGNGTHWSNPYNWDINEVPGDNDIALISNINRPATITLDGNQKVRGLVLDFSGAALTLGATGSPDTLSLCSFEMRNPANAANLTCDLRNSLVFLPNASAQSEVRVANNAIVRVYAPFKNGVSPASEIVKTGAGRLELRVVMPASAGPWLISEGTVHNYLSKVLRTNRIILGGGNTGATLSWDSTANYSTVNDAITGNPAITVKTNGTYRAYQTNYDNVMGILTIEEGGIFYPQDNYFNYRLHFRGGRTSGGNFIEGGYPQEIRSYASAATAILDSSFKINDGNDFTIAVEDGPAIIDLWMSKGGSSGSSPAANQPIKKQGAGTFRVTAGNDWNKSAYNIEGGRVLCDNPTGSGLGNTPVSVGAATLGGTGCVSSVRANISFAGNSTTPATLAPGTVNPTTGAHVIGTLKVGLAQASATNSVSFNNHSRFEAKIGPNRNASKLMMTGVVNINGASSTPSTINVEVDKNARAGTYTLIDATHGIRGRFINAQVPAKGGRLVYSADGLRVEYEVFRQGALFMVR